MVTAAPASAMATCRAKIPASRAAARRRSPAQTLFGFLLALVLTAGCTLATVTAAPARDGQAVRVAAAADLRFALDEIATAFERDTGHRLKITYGSTGNFAQQIRAGAPFHLFLAADERYIHALAADGLTRNEGALYALGRLALLVPAGSFSGNAPTLAEVSSRLAASPQLRLAIPNPDHAPYGERARDVLQHQQLWETLQTRLVLGENASQAAQFALSGNTIGGITAWSLALAPPIAALADSALIPAAWHRPLQQRMALLQGSPPGAERLYRYMRSHPAQQVLLRHGFSLPPDAA